MFTLSHGQERDRRDRPSDSSIASSLQQLTIALPPGTRPAMLSSIQAALQSAVDLLVLGQGGVIASADRVAELATSHFKADAPLQEERINRMKTVELVHAETGWVTADDLHEAFYRDRAERQEPRKSLPASDWKRRGNIFSVNYRGQELFAAYQFDANLRPLPVMKKVIAAFGPVADTWTLAAWFHFPNSWLAQRVDGKRVRRAPKDALDDAEALVHAAKMRLESYVA